MFGFDCSIHTLLRLDLKNVHFQIAKKGMSRYVEIKHNGNDIVLCLASSVEQAKREYLGDPSLDLEQYESWREVMDGTDSTNWELFNEALRGVAGGEELRNFAYRSKHSKEELSGKASESVVHVHSGTSQKTNGKHEPKVPTGSIFEQPELMVSGHFKKSNKEKKVDEVEENNGRVHTAPTPTTVGSSDRIQNGYNVSNVSGRQGAQQPAIDPIQSNSKPKRKGKNNEDKYQMYIGYRMSTEKKNQRYHIAQCDIGHWTRTLLQGDEDIKAYYSDRVVSKNNNGTLAVLHVEYQGVTAEMLCLWNHLNEKVSPQKNRSDRYAMYQSEEPETSMQLDMVSEYTLLYTNRRSNRIVIIHDDEVVRVAEVLVSIGKDFKPRVVLYTDSCLRLTEGLISRPNVKKEMKILIFCLLVVTGWGFYAKENQTTEVSAYGFTVSVNQDANEKMFDTNTEFTLTESGSPAPTGTERSAKSAQKTDKSATEGRTVRQIVTRSASREAQAASVAKQANGAELTRKRSAGKQHAESSEANQASKAVNNKAAKADGADGTGGAGGASNKNAAKKAVDTSSSSSSDEATAKDPRRSKRLAEKNNGNKSKSP